MLLVMALQNSLSIGQTMYIKIESCITVLNALEGDRHIVAIAIDTWGLLVCG